MAEENHFVKVVVDGKRIEDVDLCSGNPTGSKCTYKVNRLNFAFKIKQVHCNAVTE